MAGMATQQTFSIECEEINKRALGKAIIKFCGQEGTENDQNKKVLRRLLQAAISHLELEAADMWWNAEVKIIDDNFDVYSIKAGQGQRKFMVSMDEKDEPKVVKMKQKKVENGQQTFSIECEEINKRALGKAIIKFCGHEGTENDQNKKVLRRLLQAAISHLELEAAHVWRNAEVKIYDDNYDVYRISAGHGQKVFMVSMDEKDEPKVVKVGTGSLRACLLM